MVVKCIDPERKNYSHRNSIDCIRSQMNKFMIIGVHITTQDIAKNKFIHNFIMF